MRKEIDNYIKEAMLSKNELELKVFRFIKTEFVKFETSIGSKQLTEVDEINILNKMIKQRQESIGVYDKAGRFELSEIEKLEMDVIKRFLPKEPTVDEIVSFFDEIYNESNKNIGFYFKTIKEKYPTANGKTVSDIVRTKF